MSWCTGAEKMLKDRRVFLSVLGSNSQPRGCKSESITTQPPQHTPLKFVEEAYYFN